LTKICRSHTFPLIFFFQAEDGIRYGHVTGVQTCALPIYRVLQNLFKAAEVLDAGHIKVGDFFREKCPMSRLVEAFASLCAEAARSEERRVGKECRSRWTQYQSTINILRRCGPGTASRKMH